MVAQRFQHIYTINETEQTKNIAGQSKYQLNPQPK